jgi:formate dehydrogenase subunit gamma
MTITGIRMALGAVMLSCLFALALSAAAQQQPTEVNPTAEIVNEQSLLQELNKLQGRISIPDSRARVLIQPAGREWRQFHEVTLRWIGAIVILGMFALLLVFYLWRATVRLESGRSGHSLLRFNAFERGVHWMTAVCFIALAVTGLNITFGRPLLLPLIGADAFAAWSQWAKYAHNYLSFPFTLGIALIFLMWLPGNIPNRVDLDWFKRGGGMIGHDHPSAYRFNGGQKAIYWLVVLGGAAAALSGYVLIFPFFGTDIAMMQSAHMVHGIVAMLFVALILGHIYIGTIGMEGAFEAMGSGTVDRNWAKEHHDLWLAQEQARTGPADRRPQPASTPAE